ncbi:hypothetical protein H8A97_13085 [Bradyrhizobium sp. Arg62]|uniref:hypothetical protein n=1 Tax=Bradyrhizobium brasilense TaxID=1419277 RepID=UPI001E4F0D70|nr:hypothetical protein [Bradyrhizobium brasilense]MCC8946008.1 hypothetical protein [Bradyrhizobium brasilense]
MAIDLDTVRALVGDVDDGNSTLLLDDDTIELITAGFSSNYLAAAAVADAIAAKFSRSVTFSVEGLTIQNSQKAKAYLEMAQRLRSQATLNDAGGIGTPSISGTSTSHMDAIDNDIDRDPSRFKVGMSDYPGTSLARGRDEEGCA